MVFVAGMSGQDLDRHSLTSGWAKWKLTAALQSSPDKYHLAEAKQPIAASLYKWKLNGWFWNSRTETSEFVAAIFIKISGIFPSLYEWHYFRAAKLFIILHFLFLNLPTHVTRGHTCTNNIICIPIMIYTPLYNSAEQRTDLRCKLCLQFWTNTS